MISQGVGLVFSLEVYFLILSSFPIIQFTSPALSTALPKSSSGWICRTRGLSRRNAPTWPYFLGYKLSNSLLMRGYLLHGWVHIVSSGQFAFKQFGRNKRRNFRTNCCPAWNDWNVRVFRKCLVELVHSYTL